MASRRQKPQGPSNRWEHVEDPVVAVLLAELDRKIDGLTRQCDSMAREQTLRRNTAPADLLSLLQVEITDMGNRLRTIERRLGL